MLQKLGLLGLLMLVIASLAMGQDARRDAETPAGKTAESAESAESAEGAEGAETSEPFVPTEKVPADASIAFPVDI